MADFGIQMTSVSHLRPERSVVVSSTMFFVMGMGNNFIGGALLFTAKQFLEGYDGRYGEGDFGDDQGFECDESNEFEG